MKRLISLVSVNTPKGNSDLKNMGFTKLVKRDDGVYENVTATGKESRYWDADKPETRPDLIGFSTWCISYAALLLIAKEIKLLQCFSSLGSQRFPRVSGGVF